MRLFFQLQHADGNAVDVEHEIGPPVVAALERDLLGEGEVVRQRVGPSRSDERVSVGLPASVFTGTP